MEKPSVGEDSVENHVAVGTVQELVGELGHGNEDRERGLWITLSSSGDGDSHFWNI